MASEPRRFLGCGISFPFRFSGGHLAQSGGVRDSDAIQHVKESLQQILGTAIGERVMRRAFGASLHGMVFQPNDPRLDTWLDFTIRQSIQRWEPRVEVGRIIVDRMDYKKGVLLLRIEFRIIRTNVIGNFVWPYYINPEDRQAILETDSVRDSAM